MKTTQPPRRHHQISQSTPRIIPRKATIPSLLFSDRPPEVEAMTAHFRAPALGERKNSSESDLDYHRGDAASGKARSFLNLSHEYDRQARSNFANEAFLFGIIIIFALIWPVVQSVRALPF
jgi:hypothetical protein